MTRKNLNEFKSACNEFLKTHGLSSLRVYGRAIGVAEPTKKTKSQLIDEIVLILSYELVPIAPSRRGAPVKDTFVDPKFENDIKNLCAKYPVIDDERDSDAAELTARMREVKDNAWMLTVEDPNAKLMDINGYKKIYKGQLTSYEGAPVLLPLSCTEIQKAILISVEFIRNYDLREGDVITCYTEKRGDRLFVSDVLTINDFVVEYFQRGKFDNYSVCYPKNRIQFYTDGNQNSKTGKFLQWLVPFGHGQRALIESSPKSGKTSLLLEMVKELKKNNDKIKTLVLLVDQSPENISPFRAYLQEGELVYTTYEDDPDWQIFVSNFLLHRAKRYAECGNNVCLIIDSFNALARAFNDTQASSGGKVLAGGMESKTLQYVKRYFGTARCLEGSGAITMIGALATDTGNPADELLKSELCSISNLTIHLSETFAKQRIYPSIDLLKTQGNGNDVLQSEKNKEVNLLIRKEFLLKFSMEDLHQIINESSSFETFEENLKKKLEEKGD